MLSRTDRKRENLFCAAKSTAGMVVLMMMQPLQLADFSKSMVVKTGRNRTKVVMFNVRSTYSK